MDYCDYGTALCASVCIKRPHWHKAILAALCVCMGHQALPWKSSKEHTSAYSWCILMHLKLKASGMKCSPGPNTPTATVSSDSPTCWWSEHGDVKVVDRSDPEAGGPIHFFPEISPVAADWPISPCVARGKASYVGKTKPQTTHVGMVDTTYSWWFDCDLGDGLSPMNRWCTPHNSPIHQTMMVYGWDSAAPEACQERSNTAAQIQETKAWQKPNGNFHREMTEQIVMIHHGDLGVP